MNSRYESIVATPALRYGILIVGCRAKPAPDAGVYNEQGGSRQTSQCDCCRSHVGGYSPLPLEAPEILLLLHTLL